MFKDLVCVFVGPNDFLSYNGKIAALCSDYRVTANAGVHLKEARPLTDEEIEKLLLQIEKLGEKVEDRPPNDAENFLIEQIQRFHPEVRYIINSFHSVVEAKDDKVGPGYKVKYKDKQKEPEPKKADPQEEKTKKLSKEAGKKAADQAKNKNKKKKDDILMRMFDFFTQPGLDAEERQQRRDILKEERTELLKLYKENKRYLEKMDKQIEDNPGLMDYIELMVDQDQLDPGSMGAFTELITKNPEFLKKLDIPDTHDQVVKEFKSGSHNYEADLKIFSDDIEGLDELLEKARAAEEENKDEERTNIASEIHDLFEGYIESFEGIDQNDITSLTIDLDDEKVAIDGPVKLILQLIKEIPGKPYKFHAG